MGQEWIDFIKTQHFLIAYFITWVVSIITYKKYFNSILKYFPILLAYIFLNELLGYCVRYTDYFSFFTKTEYLNANDLIYNLYTLIFFGYFYFLYWKLVKLKKFKNWIFIGASIVSIVFVVSAIFQNPFRISLYYASGIASWVLFFCTILYFAELKSTWQWKTLKGNLMFWISLGIAVFHLFFPFIYITGYLNYDIWQEYNLQSILRILIIIMYSVFCIGFIVCRKNSVR